MGIKRDTQTDGRTDRHLDPFWDHFGADTSRISGNFGFRKQIALLNAPNRFRNRSGRPFHLYIRIGRFPNLSHNQHPAGSHSKSRAGFVRKLKKQAGRNNFIPLNHTPRHSHHEIQSFDLPVVLSICCVLDLDLELHDLYID